MSMVVVKSRGGSVAWTRLCHCGQVAGGRLGWLLGLVAMERNCVVLGSWKGKEKSFTDLGGFLGQLLRKKVVFLLEKVLGRRCSSPPGGAAGGPGINPSLRTVYGAGSGKSTALG